MRKLIRAIYVDDVVTGLECSKKCYKEVFAKGGFNLRKFVSSGYSDKN